MKDGPDIARIASLIGDPGRANMLAALMSGKALTAGELAREAGVRVQTASGHLTRLEEGGLIARERQGRHHYFRLADTDVAGVLEALMGLAAAKGQLRTRTGPRDPELRRARVCYNHLAGEVGVMLYDSLRARGVLTGEGDDIVLSDAGRAEMAALSIDLSATSRSPECKSCLDWSARRSHLAGRLGRGILDFTFAQGWAMRPEGTRIVRFTAIGEGAFRKAFQV
ncbi:ArsR family transcriptional regulator [Litoreibacter halocynthiae]|uniref:ArsR family transcriptional regulator n=1 Tax=Litoreibacter halocynthiae TaxID=1242689 RepID=A0A4R7LSG1_9RHOB|nr:helix-turn-helix transcriptional regulator [Litoreibacter halocynthiae]TDT78006.1 ArsR family transcriptional regulator [Litoreibacter halocynthiae]